MANVLYKGIAWQRRLTVTDADGVAVDLTGKDVVLELRRHAGDAALLSLSVGSGITLLAQSGATLGQADLVIGAGQSTDFDVAAHRYAVLVDDQVVTPPTKLLVFAL